MLLLLVVGFCWVGAQTQGAIVKLDPALDEIIAPDAKRNGQRKIMRYEIKPDDTIANGHLFVDMAADPAPGGTDGMKIDQRGNVYCTGAGGVWILSPEGKYLGTIRLPENAANLAFGDADSKTIWSSQDLVDSR